MNVLEIVMGVNMRLCCVKIVDFGVWDEIGKNEVLP